MRGIAVPMTPTDIKVIHIPTGDAKKDAECSKFAGTYVHDPKPFNKDVFLNDKD